MLISPTLTAEQFKQIHNALCKLTYLVEDLDGVIHDDYHKRLATTEKELRDAMSDAYAEDHRVFEERIRHFDETATLNDIKHSSWSIHEVDDMTAPHQFSGADRVLYKDHWGNSPVSASIHGNTWAALWRAADECIGISGDNHHIFIEGFKVHQDDSRTLLLHTGS